MNAKLKAKGRAIIRSKSGVQCPNINPMDYTLSLIRALNYYSAEVEDKEKRRFAIEYWKKQGKDVSILSELSDSWFSTVGAVAHMVLNEAPLHDTDVIRLDNAYNQLHRQVILDKQDKVEAKEAAPKQTKSIQDYIDEAAKVHIAELEAALDDLMVNGNTFDSKAYLTSNQVKAPVAKKISDWFKPKLSEWSSSLSEKELTDSYGGKRLINKMISQLETFITDCNTVAIIAKTTRAPRKRKAQPPSKIVAKMKWMKEFVDLSMKSIFPEKIVGSSELWLYDTAKRKLIRYVAQDGMELTVKGTTIQNWDPGKSGSKIVRKPEILKGYDAMGKRPFGSMFNEIKATLGKLNGRTSETQIILKVF